MLQLLETIQIYDGECQRLNYHQERMNRSRQRLFCILKELYLEEYIVVPEAYKKGKIKCRISYDEQIRKVEFEIYESRQTQLFYLVHSPIDYAFKYKDRTALNHLKSAFSPSSEIIIVQQNLITDTSYSNLVFKHKNGNWYTPDSPLLLGTQREYLLDEGLIEERKISLDHLQDYTHFMMINSMLDFSEERVFSVDKHIVIS